MPLQKKAQPRRFKRLPISNPPVGTRRVVLCLPDDDEYMAQFWGQLSPLGWWISWEREETHRAKDISRYWFEILDANKLAYINGEEPECSDFEPPCRSYSTNHPAIQFEPQDPFEEPGYVPPGYLLPPWTHVEEFIPVLNAQPGDVISTPLSFPGGADWEDLLTEGFARFRYSFTGAGTVELHFLNIPQGGIALLTWDDNPLTLVSVDMNRDLASVPPELISETVTELKFETGGDHHIDVTFVPIVDDSAIPLRYGGGIRKVVFCSTEDTEVTELDVRQKPDQPCILEKKRNNQSTWEQFANLQLCKPKIRTNPDTKEPEISTDDGETWEPIERPPVPPREETGDTAKCLAAANAANVLIVTYEEFRAKYATTNDVLVLTFFIFGLLGLVVLFPPSAIAIVPIIASIVTLGSLATNPATEEDREALTCILVNAATLDGQTVTFDFAAVQSAIAAESSVPLTVIELMLPLFGADGLNRAGATTAITEYDCADCFPVTCEDYLDTLATGLGEKTFLSGYASLAFGGAHIGSWQATGGYQSDGCISSQTHSGAIQRYSIVVDLGIECELVNAGAYVRMPSPSSSTFYIQLKDSAGNVLNWTGHFDNTDATWRGRFTNNSSPISGVRYIVYWWEGFGQGLIDDLTINAV